MKLDKEAVKKVILEEAKKRDPHWLNWQDLKRIFLDADWEEVDIDTVEELVKDGKLNEAPLAHFTLTKDQRIAMRPEADRPVKLPKRDSFQSARCKSYYIEED